MTCLLKQISHICYLLLLLFPGHQSYAEWQTLYQENFEQADLFQFSEWQEDTFPDKDTYSEIGRYFTDQSIHAPQGYRLTTKFGQAGWLTAESYTREPCTDPAAFISVVPDPSGTDNQVLRLASLRHTDATLIRSTEELTGQYRINLKMGFADFGDGKDLNGYDGNESAGPWLDQSATQENGFYWLAIADTIPRPHNNIWWHHHRKVVIDSDNHFPVWMQIWDGTQFIKSGRHPVMMFVLDGRVKGDALTGQPFISFSNWQWHAPGQIRALDAYLPDQWYDVVIERGQAGFTLRISGRFAYGGYRDYVARIDASANCLFHYNRETDQKNQACVNQYNDKELYWPDYFFFGDPHINYYEGKAYFDDIKLEVWEID